MYKIRAITCTNRKYQIKKIAKKIRKIFKKAISGKR